jgi:hypothetical protein
VKESRRLLQHFLAALAYRTQKALRDAPDGFGEFSAGSYVRTPHELLRHMSSVIGFARTKLHGGTFVALPLPTLAEEITRFHGMLAALHADFADESLDARISDAQFLQDDWWRPDQPSMPETGAQRRMTGTNRIQ